VSARTPIRGSIPGVWARAWLLVGLLGACNFDAAFARYCQDNPRCRVDAGRDPDAGSPPSPDVAPITVPDMAPDTAFNGPDLGVDSPASARTDGGGGGFVPKSCTSPTDCNLSRETCHPASLICIPTCRSRDDCPAWLDTCIEARVQPGDPNPPAKICACSGSQVCGLLAPNFRCNRADGLCEPSCYSSADCATLRPARMCDPFKNVCVECMVSSDCSNRSDGLTECDSIGKCVKPAS
jgi:hypothetical protein